jgi:hypothetical protein
MQARYREREEQKLVKLDKKTGAPLDRESRMILHHMAQLKKPLMHDEEEQKASGGPGGALGAGGGAGRGVGACRRLAEPVRHGGQVGRLLRGWFLPTVAVVVMGMSL